MPTTYIYNICGEFINCIHKNNTNNKQKLSSHKVYDFPIIPFTLIPNTVHSNPQHLVLRAGSKTKSYIIAKLKFQLLLLSSYISGKEPINLTSLAFCNVLGRSPIITPDTEYNALQPPTVWVSVS